LQMTEELRKQTFFNQIPSRIIPNDFFKKMHSFWTHIFQYDSCRFMYHQETAQVSFFTFSKADILIPIVALINFAVKNKSNFSLDDEIASLFSTLSQKHLGQISKYLQEFNIHLYFGKKKVVERSLSVEIDMESTQDWFSITPSFYEKDVLLTQKEWESFLTTAESFQESETEIHVFDEKTEKTLTALRTIKTSYQSSQNQVDKTYFEIPRLHVFTLLALNKSGAKLKTSAADRIILNNLHNFTHIPSYRLPEKLQCIMRDYQIKGYDWLAFLYQHKFGACLADDMGLGKTVQTIAFLAGIQEGKINSWDSERKRQHLIVAPASVIGNWEQEIKKFYPAFIMVDIVLTTYDTIRADLNTFKNMPFHVIIFDEAQALKNHKSQRTESAKQLDGIFKLSLTGTPLENNAQELCSIMNLTLPGLLPDNSAVMSLIKKGEYQAFHERIAPFILRRTKEEYLQDLPEKTEHDVYLPMTKKQKGLYGAIVDEIKQEVYKAYREKTKAQAGIVALTALLRLRQICVAPALIDTNQEKLSPKIEYLLAKIAKYVKEKTPLLVFSQFIGMLDIATHFFKKNKIAFLRIDGSVPALQRKKIVEEFQNSKKVFVLLLSLKTGGVGLNLTRARIVIHVDPWWNPAVENQASDRVHRIGQEHNVKIFRLLMKDSIEEKMLVLKQKKKELFDAIMKGASGSRGSALTKQDFDFLLVK
jgi:SNF2 family DNA or RNA helicase